VIAVPGSEKVYESVCRPNQAPPRDATKPQPGTGKARPPRATGWDPLATPPSC